MADEQLGTSTNATNTTGITIRSIEWREVFPFTHLFRAFRVAVHPSKLILALVALLLIYFGGRTLDAVWPDKHLVAPGSVLYPDPIRASSIEDMGEPRGIFISFFNYEVRQINGVISSALSLDFGGITASTGAFLFGGPGALLREHPLYFTLFAIWFLVVWSVFGGAITRIAAVHVARDEKISVRQALRFSGSKLLSFLFAPLIPLLIVLFIAAVVATGGLLFYIPVVGPIIAGLFFFLAIVAGVVAALVLVGTIGGFNLMYPTIAVEGSDSFDAISRSFSYVFARPWRMLFYTLVSIVYGALTYTFVRFFVWLSLWLTHGFVGWWLGGKAGAWWHGTNADGAQIWPTPNLLSLPYEIDYAHLARTEDFTAGLISIWVYLLVGLLGAFAISFYFSANTIIYYLMRREVDATELDDVYVEDADDDFGAEPAPIVATPAPAAGTTGAPGTMGMSDGGATTPPATDAPPQT